MSSMGAAKRLVKIEAQPEQIEVDLAKTAIIVVDMQNAFAGAEERTPVSPCNTFTERSAP